MIFIWITDHMKGLDSHDLYQTLQTKPGVFIYCSEKTKQILTHWPTYSKLSCYLKALDLNHTVKLDFPHDSSKANTNTTFCVTMIPSGHCPGSVM